MNRSTPGLPVHHQLLQFTQTHAHPVSDTIQPSHPLSSPSPPAPNPSQHQAFSWTLKTEWDTEETKIEKDTCVPLFIAALFTVARTWKQPRCPLTDGWIKKLWYIYRMKYYSAIKRDKFESVLMKWMNLEPIIQSEVSQKEKDKYHILTHICGI